MLRLAAIRSNGSGPLLQSVMASKSYADLLVRAWIAHAVTTVPPTLLESLGERLLSSERDLFIRFLRSMRKWLPEERKPARQLLGSPWLL